MDENKKNITINITTGSIVKVMLFLLLFYVLYLLIDLVLVILTAVVIASAIEPATRWFAGYKIPRIPAVIFVYAILTAIFVSIFYFFIPPLLDDASKLASVLPQYLESLSVTESTGGVGLSESQKIVGDLSQTLSFKEIVGGLKDTITGLSGGAFEAVSLIFGGAFSFILILIISFYLAVQERGISNFLRLITPLKHQNYIIHLWQRSQRKIGLWMQGQLLLGLIVGVLVYLGLTILGVPYAFLLAIIAALFEIIPVFGPILASIPAIILGFADGGASLGLMTVGLYIIIQQFENHLIYPLVVSKVVGVPPLLVILSLIIGANLAGFLGILLSVPIAAALVEFTNDIAKDKQLARTGSVQ
ncbi:MAG: AI-2E family transporter [Patescibacteria group bacterium]|nr:MAG: AI-2E family transporter [Patescibacteria group bacterium]